MALIVDPRPSGNLKYHCRVCRKGFACGRALGGHMRSHGIIEDDLIYDEDQDWDWEAEAAAAADHAPNKRMYALRANPNRLKSCRACENCGKEFSSWKCFLEHGKCVTDDVDDSFASENDDEEYGGNTNHWYKRRRSFRAKVENFPNSPPSSEEIDLANCLMMLSNAIVDHPFEASPEESCASASKDEERIRNFPITFATPVSYRPAPPAVPKGMFECKACKKVFTSHQALGGHRASHKKVKGCFAAKLDRIDGELEEDRDFITNDDELYSVKSINRGAVTSVTPAKRKQRGHECSICHRVFPSGQALGGHKRCHWITSNAAAAAARVVNVSSPVKKMFGDSNQPPLLDLTLDLNLPASDDRDRIGSEIYLNPWIRMSTKEEIESNSRDEKYRGNELKKEEDETASSERKVKLAKLSELKDMNTNGGETSSWLQVGIAADEKGAPES